MKWKNRRAKPHEAYVPTDIEHIANILTHGVSKAEKNDPFFKLLSIHFTPALHYPRLSTLLRPGPREQDGPALLVLPNIHVSTAKTTVALDVSTQHSSYFHFMTAHPFQVLVNWPLRCLHHLSQHLLLPPQQVSTPNPPNLAN